MLTLQRAVEQINATLPVDERWTADDFCRIISSAHEINRHLYLPDEPRIVKRAVPLDGDTPIHGDYLAIVWWAHWPSLIIESYADEYNLAERAETCTRSFDRTWLFVNGRLRDSKFVDSDSVPGYNVHSTVCGYLFAIQDDGEP
ncbi:hypothetical protein Poly51_59200 [Rubripirellula tenax]|uniref:Uncharacterized protein n=1 Tax=Rubripirellula tenax TaxID=2528015 RepID=A0A5C6EA69_9BACT|nr:hypothetical protein [Rubripirellula tenax]TWU44651.1 hypothetical protein Poly51_59200 [Rubripirellula tenax]